MIDITAVTAQDRAEWDVLWDGYLTFYETVLDDATTDATFATLLDPESAVHGALARDEAGRAIGLVHWLTHPGTWSTHASCYLEDLFVAPDTRVGGAGRALIAHVRDWAAKHDCAKVYWLTAETNAVARGLYDRVAERTGFIHYEIEL